MKYVQRAQLVRGDGDVLSLEAHEALRYAEGVLLSAEKQLVQAYGLWRDAMKKAAGEGSSRAARYVQETTWDLT
jgi:hypothetical protein